LQKGICRQYPAIEKMINYLIANGAEQAILSGSGPTVIGFCPNEKTAQKLSQYYTDKGYWNTITRTKGEPNEHYRCKGFYS
jgi:4-diphosphocytidyl-2-C-methyl-D-erythritol kinase